MRQELRKGVRQRPLRPQRNQRSRRSLRMKMKTETRSLLRLLRRVRLRLALVNQRHHDDGHRCAPEPWDWLGALDQRRRMRRRMMVTVTELRPALGGET
jgi:hypothetical protein